MTNVYVMVLPFLIIATVLTALMCCSVLWQSLLIMAGIIAITIISILVGINFQHD